MCRLGNGIGPSPTWILYNDVYSANAIKCCSPSLRLGPYNTRLLRAYYEFDARVATLVPILRMWFRFIGIPRSQLNSYCISLMLIYALQHATPPVLPCLQNPGSWPKNMEWFATHGFTMTARSTPLIVDGWRCDFDPPGYLLPNQNTATASKSI